MTSDNYIFLSINLNIIIIPCYFLMIETNTDVLLCSDAPMKLHSDL